MEDTWNNEMWTLLSSNLHFIISYRWLLKCVQYYMKISSTYTIMYPISTLKKRVIVFYKKCFYMVKKCEALKRFIKQWLSFQDNYNTIILQTSKIFFALLDIHDLYPSVKLYQCTLENSFQIPLKTRPHNL